MPYEGAYDWNDGQSVGGYLFSRYVRDNLKHLYFGSLPQRNTLWHDESTVTVGNALAYVILADQPFTHISRQAPPAVGDTWTQSLVLLPGTYLLNFTYRQGTDQGIFSITLGTKLIVIVDAYAGSSQDGLSGGYFHLTTGGRYVLTGTVTGKNASSSNYYCSITHFHFHATGLVDGDL